MTLLPAIRPKRQQQSDKVAVRPSSRRRRAKRGVLVGLAATATAHLGLAVAVETNRPQWRDPDYGHRLSLVKAASPGRPLIVALGSSRTQMGFRPGAMGLPNATVINFGAAGAGPFHHRLALDRLEAEGVHPDYLLVEILPVAFCQEPGAEATFRPQAFGSPAADIARVSPYCNTTVGLGKDWALNPEANSWLSLRLILMSPYVAGIPSLAGATGLSLAGHGPVRLVAVSV